MLLKDKYSGLFHFGKPEKTDPAPGNQFEHAGKTWEIFWTDSGANYYSTIHHFRQVGTKEPKYKLQLRELVEKLTGRAV